MQSCFHGRATLSLVQNSACLICSSANSLKKRALLEESTGTQVAQLSCNHSGGLMLNRVLCSRQQFLYGPPQTDSDGYQVHAGETVEPSESRPSHFARSRANSNCQKFLHNFPQTVSDGYQEHAGKTVELRLNHPSYIGCIQGNNSCQQCWDVLPQAVLEKF